MPLEPGQAAIVERVVTRELSADAPSVITRLESPAGRP
jgi:hypothetical protein